MWSVLEIIRACIHAKFRTCAVFQCIQWHLLRDHRLYLLIRIRKIQIFAWFQQDKSRCEAPHTLKITPKTSNPRKVMYSLPFPIMFCIFSCFDKEQWSFSQMHLYHPVRRACVKICFQLIHNDLFFKSSAWEERGGLGKINHCSKELLLFDAFCWHWSTKRDSCLRALHGLKRLLQRCRFSVLIVLHLMNFYEGL